MTIYSFIGAKFEEEQEPKKKREPKKEHKVLKFIKNVWKKRPFKIGLLSTYVLIMVLILLPFIKKESKIIEQNREDMHTLVEYAYQDFYSDEYKVIETIDYMVELFPYGCTDNDLYQVEDGRLIKETWYKNNHQKVAHEEYYLLEPKGRE